MAKVQPAARMRSSNLFLRPLDIFMLCGKATHIFYQDKYNQKLYYLKLRCVLLKALKRQDFCEQSNLKCLKILCWSFAFISAKDLKMNFRFFLRQNPKKVFLKKVLHFWSKSLHKTRCMQKNIYAKQPYKKWPYMCYYWCLRRF